MTYYLRVGHFHREDCTPVWNNFIEEWKEKNIMLDVSTDDREQEIYTNLLAEHNARDIDPTGDNLEFETEEDATAFVLRFS